MKVSIITVVYNNVSTIEESIRSVLSQNYDNLEYIVVDGVSTDGTMEVIQQYASNIDVLISEKDEGLYDALNKGIRLATGDVVGIMHADDLYFSADVVSDVVQNFQENHADCLYGDLVYVDREDTDKILRNWKSGPFHAKKFLMGWMPPHPTFFVKRDCLLKNGLYDTSFKTSADYELMLRYLFKHQLHTSYLDKKLVRMRAGGVSNGSLKNRLVANMEDMKAWEVNDLRPRAFTRYMKPARKLGQFNFTHYSYKLLISLSLILPFLLVLIDNITEKSVDLSRVKEASSLLFSWGVVAISVPVVIKIARLKKIMDSPNNRSAHFLPVPTLGGISIFAAVSLSIIIWGGLDFNNGLQYILGALILTFFTGLKDDMLVIAPDKKLISQFYAASLIILGSDLRIGSFYGIMGISELPYWVSVCITVFVFVVVTNAYNLIDGIDGLASMMGTIAALLFGSWFLIAGFEGFAILAFSTAGALIGFVKYNFSKKQKIFLGDTGSLIIGLLTAALALLFIKMNGQVKGERYFLPNAPFITIMVLSIPLFDTLRVFVIRMLQKKSPFSPDRNHIHHLLIARNPSHKRATIVLSVLNLLFVFLSIKLFTIMPPSPAFTIVVLFFSLYLLICYQLQHARPNAFKGFCLRYIPSVKSLLWPEHHNR